MKAHGWFGILAMAFSLPALAASYNATAADNSLTPGQKMSDLHQLVAQVQSGYGPLRYKADERGIRLEELANQYALKVLKTKTNGEYYYLLNQFIAEFHDSHFGGLVPTTHEASLPFSTDLVEGKVLVDEINRENLPETTFPFAKGDEVVSVDGTPALELAEHLGSYYGSGDAATALRNGAEGVAWRAGTRVPVPAATEAVVKIRHGTTSVIDEVKLSWTRKGEPMDEFAQLTTTPEPRDYDRLDLGADWAASPPQVERNFRCAGTTRIAIPKDATTIMSEPFVAYYHPTAKGNVGYLRIPHYIPEREERDLRFAQYEYAVSVLEKNTVGLIIDQDHNCGGSVDWLERIVGLFIDRPVAPLQFRFLANKEELLGFKKYVAKGNPHTIEHQGALRIMKLLEDAWKAGQFMTSMTDFHGGETLIPPHPIRYTRPIVMLIDEMSGSGGDAFPAQLQGFGRARLLGTRTMGAGGHVEEQPELFYSRLSVRMTKSLFFRPDGVAVENNGAVPDYPYAITREDFMYGYRAYHAYAIEKLHALIATTAPLL